VVLLRCAAERYVIEISGFTVELGLCVVDVKFGVVAAEKLKRWTPQLMPRMAQEASKMKPRA